MGIKKNRDTCYEPQAWSRKDSPETFLYLTDKGEVSWGRGDNPGTYLLFFDEIWIRGLSGKVVPRGPLSRFKADKLRWIPRVDVPGNTQMYLTKEVGPNNEKTWYYYPKSEEKTQKFYPREVNTLQYKDALVPIRPWELN